MTFDQPRTGRPVQPVRPMFDSLCALPLEHDLFAHALHPSEPLLAVGLSSGHVATLRLPPVGDDGEGAPDSRRNAPGKARSRRGSNGTDTVDTAWRTRRHQGSCRTLAYSLDGRQLYSAGLDGLIKAADSETGRVTGKVAIPTDSASVGASSSKTVGPTVLHALSPQTLLLGTDAGTLHLYDLRDPAPSLPLDAAKPAFINPRPAQTHHPHPDDIASLTPLPPSATSTSGYSKQWLTTGGSTLALTDLRRGVLVQSEDQEELLLSSLYITGLPARKSSGSSGEKAVVGGGDGVITLWEKGQWDDQDERINVSREGETLDVLAALPVGVGGAGGGKTIAVGLGDGKIRFVQLGANKVVGEVQHDEVEGVVALGFDVGGRMISGGGQVVKVWREHIDELHDEDEEEDEVASGKLADDESGDDEDDEEEKVEESSEEEEQPRKRRKKRKRGKGPAPAGNGLSFAGLD